MKQRVGAAVLAVACFVLGAVLQRLYDVRSLTSTPPPQSVKAGPQVESPAPEAPGAIPAPPDLAGGAAVGLRLRHTSQTGREGGSSEPAQPEPASGSGPRRADEAETHPREHRELLARGHSRRQNVIDWFPNDHPAMPNVVEHGPAALGTATRGCGSCHLPTGKGRPENAAPVGLPTAYFIRQIRDFRAGLRRSADPRKPNTNTMIDLAKAMTEDELQAAAEYFGSMPWTPWIRVVETDRVPKTRIAGNLFIATEQARTEPIAGRIIEVPENEEQAETYRNPRSGFVAYVPVGSIRKGNDLVTTGGMRIVGDRIVQGKTTACGTCHGIDLLGVADVPPIAGRSPSYIVRQLFDMQRKTRNGASAELMKIVIANLTPEDMLAIAAYVSSRVPPVSRPADKPPTTVARR